MISEPLLARVRAFVDREVTDYLRVPGQELKFPTPLVTGMREIGLFRLNVPTSYGGSEASRATILEVTRELSRGWLSLPAILGSHFRAAPYFLKCGTQAQRDSYLPRLATGELLAAHAFSERGGPAMSQLSTVLRQHEGGWVLDGRKHYVTNVADADISITVARVEGSSRLAAVVVDPKRPGASISPDLHRPGVKGVSLCELGLDRYPVAPEEIIGGPEADVLPVLREAGPPKSLAFAGRASGAAEAVLGYAKRELQAKIGTDAIHPVTQMHYGELLASHFSIQSIFRQAASEPGLASCSIAKVACARELQKMIGLAMTLLGGSAYANEVNELERIYRDAAALEIAGGANDVLLSRVAAEATKNWSPT